MLYVWIDGDCQDKFESLGEAQHWMLDNISEGKLCYIVDEENNIVDPGNETFWQP